LKDGEEVRVSLAIFDLLSDPLELSNQLGLEPTRTWTKGEPIARSNEDVIGSRPTRIAQSNAWFYRVPSSSKSTLHGLLQTFLRTFVPVQTKLADLSDKSTIQLAIYLEYDQDLNPNISVSEIEIESSLLAFLARINASISIDVAI
jgi:hypothetical protein